MTEPGTPPVGDEYGLKPRMDHTLIKPPFDSRELVSEERYEDGTEYGGVDGYIQPAPHVPNARERLAMLYAIDPDDTGDSPERGSVAAPELEGNF